MKAKHQATQKAWFKLKDKQPPHESYILLSSNKCFCMLIAYTGDDFPFGKPPFQRMTHWMYVSDGILCGKCLPAHE